VTIKEANFPRDAKVFTEKEILNLVKLPQFKGQTMDNWMA
jgi:hypothetical protein